MRRVEFSALDRLVLVPMELGRSLKLFLVFAFVAILYAGLDPGRRGAARKHGRASGRLFALGLGAALAGSVLVPLLLPLFPFALSRQRVAARRQS